MVKFIKRECLLYIENVLILLMVICVFGILGEWNPNIFCYDDNAVQWLPVIDDVYSNFFRTGSINYWNYYLMSGINILETGIYSIVNPLMFVSYIINHIFNVSNTITVYMVLTLSCGLSVYNYTFKKLDIEWLYRYTILFCMLGCSAYWRFGHWYYVVNNVLIGALIFAFFSLYLEKNKVNKFYIGVVLGFSIYLGNVQYTIMWYLVFALVMLCLFILNKEIQNIICIITNVITGCVLSLPQIILFLRSKNNTTFEGKNSSFFEFPLSLHNMIVHGLIPDVLLETVNGTTINEHYFSYGFYFIGLFLICFIFAFYLLTKDNKREKGDNICLSYLIVTVFFILWVLGKRGIVALIMYQIPIINSFRYLQKIYFVIIQMLVAPTIYVVIKYKKNRVKVICAIGLVLSLINIISFGGIGESPRKETALVKSEDIDVDNYKVLTILGQDGDFLSKVQNYFVDEKVLIRNFPAFYHVYSVGGYNLSFTEEQYGVVSELMQNEPIFSQYAYANACNANEFVLNDQSINQIKNNAVKYVITDSENIILDFKDNIQIECSKIVDIGDGYQVIVLDKVDSIVSVRETGQELDFINSGNILQINSSDVENCNLNIKFIYNELYKAYYDDGECMRQLEISSDENGFINICCDTINVDYIYLEYKDIISELTILSSIITMFLMVFVYTYSKRKN